MSKISINTASQGVRASRPTIENLQAGEAFRFVTSRQDQVYFRIDDERAYELNYDNVLYSYGMSRGDVFYASLKSGQVYRGRRGTTVVPLRVTATAERE